MKFAYYHLQEQVKNYKNAKSEEEKLKIARDFFDNDAELFLDEMKRHL